MLQRLEGMLTSRFAKWWGWASAVGLLAMGAAYSDFSANQRQGFQWCLENSEACQGREIRLPVWDVVDVETGQYAVFKATGPIPIKANTDGLGVGDTVSVLGHFDPHSASIVEASRTVHTRRPLKKALSGLGLVLFFCGLPWCLRFREGRLVYRG